jgi:tetratricopeptide (TPR) repeat protein
MVGEMTLGEAMRPIEEMLVAGRYEEARARCLGLLEQKPQALRVQRLLGEISLAQGWLAEADKILRRVLRADPEDALAIMGLALIYERRNDREGALRCYHQVCELRPGNRHAFREYNRLAGLLQQPAFQLSRAGLARLYMRGGLWTRALLEWRAVLKQFPQRLDAQAGLAEVLWRLNELKALEAVCRAMLQDAEYCLKALLLLGFRLELDGRTIEARPLFREVAALDPDLIMARAVLAHLATAERETLLEALTQASAVTVLVEAKTLPQLPTPASVPAIETLPTMVMPVLKTPGPQQTPGTTGVLLPITTQPLPGVPLNLPSRSVPAGKALAIAADPSPGGSDSTAAESGVHSTPGTGETWPIVLGSGYSLPQGAVSEPRNGSKQQDMSEAATVSGVDYRQQLARATSLRLRGRIAEALPLYEEILKCAPDLVTQVINELQAIADNTPERGSVYHLLGEAYLRQGNYLQALEAYNQGLALVRQQ